MEKPFTPPDRPSAGTAAEAIQLAELALQDALLAGTDTGPARAALDVGRKAAAVEREAADQDARTVAQTERTAARQAEADTIEQAQQQMVTAIGSIEAAPFADPLPEPVESPILKLAAQQLAQARTALAKAEVPHGAAIADRNAMRARLEPKTSELEAIRARRAAGDEQPSDAVTMTALGMDLEDLGRLLAPLEAAVAATTPADQQRAVVDAEAALVAARRRAELDGMVDRVRALEQHFVTQVRTLRLEAQKRGQNNFASIFAPADALRRLAYGEWI